MSDRKGLADRLEAVVDLGWARGQIADDLRRAAAALRQEPSVEEVARTLWTIRHPEPNISWEECLEWYREGQAENPDGCTSYSTIGEAFKEAQAIHAMYRRGEP